MKEISSLEQLEGVWAESEQRPVFIFKHSTTCPISAGAHDKVSRYIQQTNGSQTPEFYLVKVIESRPVSNAIEAKLGVRHQSPQLILVKDRKPLWSASHYGIHGEAIAESLAEQVKGEESR